MPNKKKLVVVESPTKARTIQKYLGRGYEVKASGGHLVDLPKSKLGVDIEEGFKPHYITIRGKGNTLNELKKAAQKADKVYLAADPDREGEAICWHLANKLNLDPAERHRVEFNEITKDAIKEAFTNPRTINQDLVDAQQARRVLDRLVGYQISPILWDKISKRLSAGRVQSVALRLVADREEEIEQFEPEEYWSLEADLEKNGRKFSAQLKTCAGKKMESIPSREQMEKVVQALEGESFRVKKVTVKDMARKPSPPFTTSTLQQQAAQRLGYNTRKTMRIAQRLYEGVQVPGEGLVGLITYLRTDSTRVSEQARSNAQQFILSTYGPNYLPPSPHKFAAGKRAQEAHEAIRPTAINRRPEQLSKALKRDELRLYRLIWERFTASFMAESIDRLTAVDIEAGEYGFRAAGSVRVFDGYTLVWNVDKKDRRLPALEAGDQLKLLQLKQEQHFTQPPPRYNDASLVKTLEELGIGRPSTYSPTIETLLSRSYIVREDKAFFLTELGRAVNDLMKKYFSQVVDVSFTARLEDQLDQVEEGQLEWEKLLHDFYPQFARQLEEARKKVAKIEVASEKVTDEVCPQCGRNLVVKMGRYGKFLACPGFPQCSFSKPLEEKVGVTCPACREGEVVEKRSRKGRKFYGCNRYPDCDFVSWDLPVGRNCPRCGSPLVTKQKGAKSVIYCGNKECQYKEGPVQQASGRDAVT